MGTERALKFELKTLGATALKATTGAVLGEAPLESLCEFGVFSRIASRILLVVDRFVAADEAALVEQLSAFAFEDHLDMARSFAITAHLTRAPWDHTRFAAQRVKDIIVDRLRDLGRGRHDVDTRSPEIRYVFHWEKDQVTLSLDVTGAPLHKRGYRDRDALAPMRETLAAAVLAVGHADIRRPFHDVCCGSGTLAIEQAMRSLNRAPGRDRLLAAERWRFASGTFAGAARRARERAYDEEHPALTSEIRLSDWHANAVATAERQIEDAGLTEHLVVERADARDVRLSDERPVIIANLPFGERLGGDKHLQLVGFYRTLASRLADVQGARVLLFTAQQGAGALLGPPLNAASAKEPRDFRFFSGPLKTILYRWDLIDDEGRRVPTSNDAAPPEDDVDTAPLTLELDDESAVHAASSRRQQD